MLQFALLIALPTPQAADVVYTARTAAPAVDIQVDDVLAHPRGGVVAVSGLRDSASFSSLFDTIRVQRLDENGDVLWTVDRAKPAGSDGFAPPRAVATPDGRIVLGLTLSTGFLAPSVREIVAYDVVGALDWEFDFAAPSGGAALVALGVLDSGEVVVGGRVGATFSSTPSAYVAAFDSATGQEIWDYTRPTEGRIAILAEGGGVSIGFGESPFSARIERLDASGALVYSRVEPVEFEGTVSPVASDASGAVLARVSWLGPDQWEKLSPGGAIVWSNRNLPIPDEAQTAGLLLADGGAVVAGGVASCCPTPDLTRVAGDGTITWTQALGSAGLSARPRVMDSPAGVFVVPGAFAQAGATDRTPGLDLVLSATGAALPPLVFAEAPTGMGDALGATLDSRGNTWVSARVGSTATLVEGRLYKLVLEGDPSSGLCNAAVPNSTGLRSRIRTAGSGQAARDNLTLAVDRLPASAAVLFLNARLAATIPNAGGSLGTLCLGSDVSRYVRPGEIRFTGPVGEASLQLRLPETPRGAGLAPVVAGQSFFFQAWHRDLVGGQQESNFTNAVRVDFF